jgi:predicted NBD/HSP70 family sugar kinase
MAYLNLGTGIAAGVVRHGRLWRGVHGTAGEVGHISVDPNGPLCRCGQRGCIEALAGGASIARRWGGPAALPVLAMMDAADAGDERAQGLRRDLMTGVAAAVRILVLALDVDVVVVGGGLSALGDRLMEGVVAQLDASAETSAFMRSLRLRERVEPLPAGSPAAAFGAALVGAGAASAHTTTQERAIHG